MVPPYSTPGRLAVLHKKNLFTPAGQVKDTVIRTLKSIPCTQGTFWLIIHFRGWIHQVSVFTPICQNRWTLPWGFLSSRRCSKGSCHCSWWNRSYFSFCESQSVSMGFWADIDTTVILLVQTQTQSCLQKQTLTSVSAISQDLHLIITCSLPRLWN